MARWQWETRAVGFARQTDYSTENTNVTPISGGGDVSPFVAEVTVPEFVRKLEEFKSATGQVGAGDPPAVGSKHGGKFSVRSPLYAYKAGYNPAADVPGTTARVLSPIMALVGNVLGSNAGTPTAAEFAKGTHLKHQPYAAGVVQAASTSTVVKVTDATIFVEGALFVSSTADDGVPAIGWVKKTDATPAPDEVTLAEAVPTTPDHTPAAGDNVYPTSTAYLTDNTPVPLTFSIMGNNAAFRIALVGCVAKSAKFSGKSGETPMVEIEFEFTEHKWYASGGALLAADAMQRIPPVLGVQDGRLTYGTSGSGGSAQCGIADFMVSVDYTIAYVPCHGKAQGVSEAIITERKIRAEFLIPHDSADAITAGEHLWEKSLVDSDLKSIGVYCGTKAGKIWAMFLPSLYHVEQPKLESRDGLLYWKLAMAPGVYTSDSSSIVAVGTPPADTLFRVAVA